MIPDPFLRKRERLGNIGIEDLNLRGTHILLSKDSGGRLVKDDDGLYETRVCNFELLRRIRDDGTPRTSEE